MTDLIVTNNSILDTKSNIDIFICSLGYEKRSISVAQKIYERSTKKLAIKFNDRQVHSFESNKKWFQENNFLIVDSSSLYDYIDYLDLLKNVTDEFSKKTVNIMIDISSMSRPMIANVCFAIRNVNLDCNIDFVYTSAKFIKPESELFPVTSSAPVIPQLSGWSIEPDEPVTAIIGLGYEYDYAIGAIEQLEPNDIWCFFPNGIDKKFDSSVRTVNKQLLDVLPSSRIIDYSLTEPMDLYIKLNSLTSGLIDTSRIIYIPFGPKIFSLICTIASIQREPAVAVWRISGEQCGEPYDHSSIDSIVCLNIRVNSKNGIN
ncbi:MAG: hypothetical protein GKR93_14495 [Gammaproteobacteria bacterium]|nr:hypothetical protein [Gammaproteobacteria bacterium]